MNEYEYLVLARGATGQIYILHRKPFDTRDAAMRFAFRCSPSSHPQVVAIVRHPARDWVSGPYPFCRTPALCHDAGYCKRDPACNN